MLKNTNKNVEILETKIILEKYKENIESIQKSLSQLELEVSNLQSEGLVELEKLANELNMLQLLSTSIKFKANSLNCNNNKTIVTSITE
ncbi:hypothetical protein B1B04_15045 [Lysinibacillus sp. KCTC 33748]|uniref:hypothetical protein n=1 Tax=unclassified Lysinibacillus TaxID=2636778 RepID=UPI0009A5A212|nr:MULTISPECIES: hypothetical protein [unclassified Lysinibacillus]OXS72615.1 hypothetical protein B1B04_15045 [Lysinibacillus sp. KCTC 33748]SKB91726.1 hypothetical protein SAMN06295926_11241 [Lysinibacillus sp. AC-3]